MSQPHPIASSTMNMVEKARTEVNSLKEQISRLAQSDVHGEGAATARSLMKSIAHAEATLEKAEVSVKRVKNAGRVPPRPTASVPESLRAKRALAVLIGAPSDSATPQENKVDSQQQQKQQHAKRSKTIHFFTVVDQHKKTPLREDSLNNVVRRAVAASKLNIVRVGSRGVGFECGNVFRAFMWFAEQQPEKRLESQPQQRTAVALTPEHISCFGIDESNAGRWSSSKHAVFGVLTERANAAVRYFWAREESGSAAFVALAQWLASHRTMFSDKCEDRQLAFDASRGFFLPACVRSFDGVGGPRFTRGSIPLRTNSAQPTVRVPQSNSAQTATVPPQGATNSAASRRTTA